MSYVLRLEDDVDQVDFISDASAAYFLLDGTLEMEPPDKEDVRIGAGKELTRDLVRVSLKTRTIEFAFQIRGSSQEIVMDRANKVFRMLGRATNQKILAGGSMGAEPGYNSGTAAFAGTATGDNGLRLRFRYGATSTDTYTNELAQSMTDDRIYTFKVISGEINVENPLSVEGSSNIGQTYVLTKVVVELECEPLALGSSRVISAISNLHTLVYPDTGSSGGWTNRMIIPAANIPGSHDALTRITTNLTGYGIIIARDAGKSLLNCPSYPTNTGGVGTLRYIVPYGYAETAVPKYYNVELMSINASTGVPTVRWRTNGGSWSSNTALSTAYNVYYIDGTDIGFFTTTTDWRGDALVSVGEIFTFRNNQASFFKNTNYGVYTNRANFMTEAGVGVGVSQRVLVQNGVNGKYRVMVSMNTQSYGGGFELKAKYYVTGVAGDTYMSETGWVKCPTVTGSWVADLGMLDLTPHGTRGVVHPHSTFCYNIVIFARGITMPTSGALIKFHRIMVVPAADDYAYLRAGWGMDWGGMEVYTNYDPSAPYIVEAGRDFRGSTPSSAINIISPLDETHEGNVITLIPGVTNTLYFQPLFSGVNVIDYREKQATQEDLPTGRVEIGIRPRYMFVG